MFLLNAGIAWVKKEAAKDVRERYRTLELYNCQYDIQARTCSDGII